VIDSIEATEYGRRASEALSEAIAQAKASGPLAPVTVIVPSNFVGLSARRLVGSGELRAGSRQGIANVSFVTPFRLAELVAADLLLDRQPITNPVLGAAVRQVLADDPDVYRAVAEHEATEAALAALFAELSNVDEAGLESIEEEGSTAARLAVTFHRRIAEKLAAFHTEHDLATEAAERLDLAERLAPMGHLVWYLPAPVTPAIGRFLGEALRAASSSSVIVGLTGVEAADEPVWRACEAAGVPRTSGEVSVPVASSIVSVTDGPEEIREVCSAVAQLVADGVALDRVGVFFPTPDPYVRIIEQQFGAAGIPINGPDPRRLSDSVAGRTLLGALGLPAVRWRRDRVMEVVSGGPLRFADEPIRPTIWDQLSREAGVVIDHADWRRKIEHDQVRTEQWIADLADEPASDSTEYRLRRLRDRVADGKRLVEFVDELHRSVRAVDIATSWTEKCAAARDLLHSLLGSERTHGTWPDQEQEAFARVEDALSRLAALDQIEPTPSTAVFQRALGAELDVARARHGRFGHGVVYGPIATAVGHDLDAVFVVGCAEGVLPVPRRDDAILPDALRLRALDQLEPRAARLHHQHRAFLAVLAAAPPERRVLTFARGDLRSNRRALPSRWLLDSASAMVGHRVVATDFDTLDQNVVRHVSSFASALRDGGVSCVAERDLATLGTDVTDGSDPVEHGLAQLVGKGFAAQVQRAGSAFTEFDGNLGARVGADDFPLPGVGDRAMSPSRLETWASCGFRYFLGYVLEVSDRDDPERNEELSALDRGSLIHKALEQFISEAIESGPPAPSEPWPTEAVVRLHEIADDLCDEYVAIGRTGRRANWRVQRDDLHDLLDAFVHADNAYRASHGATPAFVELDLGVKSGEVVPIELPNGDAITLRGMIDRVDTTTDGRVLINDYKSGKGKKYDDLTDDPFLAGTTLQLGMYAEGAMQATGASSASAHYWLVERAGQQHHGYEWTDEKRTRFHEVLTAITTGIASGVFAAAPGDWDTFRLTNDNCGYCDFDSVCVRDRGDHAAAKASAPELAVRVALTPPEPNDDEVER
jgi:ATP-dependent helicase/nuclease subunit B